MRDWQSMQNRASGIFLSLSTETGNSQDSQTPYTPRFIRPKASRISTDCSLVGIGKVGKIVRTLVQNGKVGLVSRIPITCSSRFARAESSLGIFVDAGNQQPVEFLIKTGRYRCV